MDIQTLRIFAAVAREGNLSRAADKLALTQPAVSLQIKGLQAATGLTLFTRSAQGMNLTRDGAALLPLAEKVLAAQGDFKNAAASLHTQVRGRLRIGTILDPEFTRLGAFLKVLVEMAPQVETELRQAMSGEVLAQIERGELDVGFYLGSPGQGPGGAVNYEPNRPPALSVRAHPAINSVASRQGSGQPLFAVRELTHFTYRVLAPAGWGPQVRGKGWKALAALPWIATPPASAHHRLLASVFEPLGVEPHRVALVDQEASMLDLVKSGVGLSLVRDSIAMRESHAAGLVIADQVSLQSVLGFVSLQSQRQAPVVASAWKALEAVWA
ncbi:MAG: LysR family transcriptional regulator [Pseudomonadota bacterium]|uniref:LysR substrate-binding domain-containing protein n=1 Tax=Polaromonas sp. TaxID=1869339 RepID=UPI0017BEF6E5|nr:LysR family transcriptional regulator [Polaromonas sp.]MBA3593310.1 LysR family transcriptional regulator [Polaromonas sp.]MDQ3270915.1 LysR family transcriptional regulator [Pseudomonadota bacterium]